MNMIKSFATLGTIFLSCKLANACEPPKAPQVPDGQDSTLDEMITTRSAVKDFQAANGVYLSCIDEQIQLEKQRAEDGDNDAKKRYAIAAANYNSAVAREEQVAGEFNSALRAYKSANPK